MNDHEMRDAYEAALRKTERTKHDSQLPPERLEALVNQSGSEDDRLRSLDVLMSTAEGRREFEVAWAAARAAREQTHSGRQRFTRPAYLAAAAVLLVSVISGTVLLRKREPLATSEAMRGTESPLPLVSPRTGPVSREALRFVWRGVQEARNYTLVLVDSSGAEVFARTTRDTSTLLPDSVSLTAGSQYLWWVQATLADGSTLSAVTERIRVKP